MTRSPGKSPISRFFFEKNTKTLDFKRPTFDDSSPMILSSPKRADFNAFSKRDIFPEFTRRSNHFLRRAKLFRRQILRNFLFSPPLANVSQKILCRR